MARRRLNNPTAEEAQAEHDTEMARIAEERAQRVREEEAAETGEYPPAIPNLACRVCSRHPGDELAPGSIGEFNPRVAVYGETDGDTFLCNDCADRICSRCDREHSVANHGGGKCYHTTPILMGDGSTENHRCPCPGFISLVHAEYLTRPIEDWSEDQQHASWAMRHGMEFCQCGMPGTAHFRALACPFNAAGEPTSCTGFLLSSDKPESDLVSVWGDEKVDDLNVLAHVITFGGRVALDIDSLSHKALWDGLSIGKKVTITLTAEVVGTDGHVAIKSKGYVIGVAAVAKVKATSLQWTPAPAEADEEDFDGEYPEEDGRLPGLPWDGGAGEEEQAPRSALDESLDAVLGQ